jgi:hypothetical protein
MIRHQTENVLTIGTFFVPEPAAVSNRIANFLPPGQRNGCLSWNAHTWDFQ